MGCVQAKPQDLEKLKLENGYVSGVNGGRTNTQRPPAKDSGKSFRYEVDNGTVKFVVSGGAGGDGGGDTREIERERNGGVAAVSAAANGGNVSRRITLKKIGGDELVDGWPKWLVDNIPRDVLAGLVPKTADSYDKLAKIGQGTYSNVYKARDRDTGKIVALKKVRFDTSESESVKFMAREIMILRKLDHPNIIKLEGLATSRMQYSLYLVFDFMLSDLTRIINRPGERLTEPQVKCYIQQLLSGLQHCHERGILHRDIKASNLLIDRSGMLKIADFGLANYFNPKQKRPLTSRVVTLWYRAPELLLGSTDYGVGIDLWSAGCLLAEMFVGRPFMPGRTEVEQLHRIFKLCGSPSEDYWRKMKLPTSFRPQQHYQPSFREAFRDFPPSVYGLLTTFLALDPSYRGSASSALLNDYFSSSPLACDLSGLPLISKEEDEPTRTNDRKKRKTSKTKTRANCQHGKNDEVTEQDKGDSESYNKEEKNADRRTHSQDMGNSGSSSTSSGFRPKRHEGSLHSSLSPVLYSQRKRSPKTEGHPNASKNIQNFTLLQASITDIVNHKEAIGMPYHRRSLSTLDFRALDPEKISKLFGLDKD